MSIWVPLEKRFSTPLIFAEFRPTGFRRPEPAIAAIRPDLISIRTVRRPKLHTPPPDPRRSLPTSVVLQRLHDEAPKDHFTLGWLMGSLRKRSFGIIMLLLAVVAIAPGISEADEEGADRPGISRSPSRPGLR